MEINKHRFDRKRMFRKVMNYLETAEIKWIYFVNISFTEVNIHPSEVNLTTFFLGKQVL